MTITEKLKAYVALLDAAEDKLQELELDREELNALLKRWCDHRRKWVRPYGQSGGWPGEAPSFCPEWSDLSMEDTSSSAFHFTRYQYSEEDSVYVETAYLLDPDAWIEQDKVERVTKETWSRQRERAIKQQAADRLEVQAEALRKAGFKVEKQ